MVMTFVSVNSCLTIPVFKRNPREIKLDITKHSFFIPKQRANYLVITVYALPLGVFDGIIYNFVRNCHFLSKIEKMRILHELNKSCIRRKIRPKITYNVYVKISNYSINIKYKTVIRMSQPTFLHFNPY